LSAEIAGTPVGCHAGTEEEVIEEIMKMPLIQLQSLVH
jgi:hypothetical protein